MRRALIIGAGIAGLAAAIALRRADWDVEIVDQASGPSDTGTGIYLPATGRARWPDWARRTRRRSGQR
jgi:2-polyprenyl-6-methoxyphenol hydroxylase-like FAD-dependent oxidoreductase